MSGRRAATVVLFGWLAVLEAQQPRLVADIAIAEAEWRDAQQAWMQSDPTGLVRDLYKKDPAVMQQRIRRVAELRDNEVAKRQVYLDAMIQRVAGLRGRFASSTSGASAKIPAGELKKDL